jgi:hypothetical protein
MGIYCFKSLRCPQFIKVGKYSKLNPWSRVAHRGFRSCACPKELGEVTGHDVELLAWYPTLGGGDERAHKRVQAAYRVEGTEWFSTEGLESTLAWLAARAGCSVDEARAAAAVADRAAAFATRRRL